MINQLNVVDPELAGLVDAELTRQEETISLIASENLTSRAVLELNGSVLTNKVVEGYPGKRYHAGCQYIDDIERLAIARARKLFGAEHANVQAHSGVSANMAVYTACLRPGDRVLAPDLAHGGHLSHGAPASITGSQLYNVSFYGVNRETEQVDFDEVERLTRQHQPRLIITGFSAYPRAIEYRPFREIADRVGAYLLVDMAHITGLVAAGYHPSPVGLADFVTGTCYKTLRGTKGGFVLCQEEWAKKIDYAVFPGTQGTAMVSNVAAKALIFRLASTGRFKTYCQQVIANARAMAAELGKQGLRLVAGGTDTHQLLVDLCAQGISGARGEEALHRVGIDVNKNLIPFDISPPDVASGLRLGTTVVTSRGMQETEMREIASLITTVLEDLESQNVEEVRCRVRALCDQFPVYLDRWEVG
jgi:glycine hydroxymethyltransferase